MQSEVDFQQYKNSIDLETIQLNYETLLGMSRLICSTAACLQTAQACILPRHFNTTIADHSKYRHQRDGEMSITSADDESRVGRMLCGRAPNLVGGSGSEKLSL